MKMPAGWGFTDTNGNYDYIIKLKKNLCGTATGTRNWYKKLAAGLIARGYTQSNLENTHNQIMIHAFSSETTACSSYIPTTASASEKLQQYLTS